MPRFAHETERNCPPAFVAHERNTTFPRCGKSGSDYLLYPMPRFVAHETERNCVSCATNHGNELKYISGEIINNRDERLTFRLK